MSPRPLCAALLALGLGACSENEVNFRDVPPDVPRDGGIRGQLCDEVRQVWLEGATVYTHLYDDDGVIYDTVTDVTDAEGRFELAVPTDRTYTVYVARGNDLVQQFDVTVPPNQFVDLPAPSCFGDVDVSVAVVTGAYDDLEVLIQAVGIASFTEIDGQATTELTDFLTNPTALNEYQVVFFNGGHLEQGVIYPVTDPTVALVHDNLRQYVQNGGVVFASDWAYDLVEQIWPDAIDFLGDDAVIDAAQRGEPGDVDAVVVDEFMAAAVGFSQVTVAYDKSVFPVMVAAGSGTRVYLAGTARYRQGQTVADQPDAPLAVSFEDGNGRVYYTSYRNEANGAGDMLAVLQYLLSAVQ